MCTSLYIYINQAWILFEDNVNTPWSQGLKIQGICYQDNMYSGCLECVTLCVLVDELLYS